MVNVLIVDDFIADRKNIRAILSGFSGIDIHITADCENGLQALEQIEHTRPDIVITDIEMPLCDGFELARSIRSNYPEIKIIFCSLYDEFEYARKALFFGGYGYILKPIDPSELEQCIQRVTGQLSDESVQLRSRQEYEDLRAMLDVYKPVLSENILRQLLFGGSLRSEQETWEHLAYLKIDLQPGAFALAYIEIDDFDKITGADTFEQKQLFLLKIALRIQDLLGREVNMPLIKVGDAHYAVIINLPTADSRLVLKRAYDCFTRVLVDFIRSDVSLTIALSKSCLNLREIAMLYEQCLYQMKHKFLLGKGKLILPVDVPFTQAAPDLDFNAIQKEVRFLLNSGACDEINAYIDHLFRHAPAGADAQYLRNLCFYLAICTQVVLNENNENFNQVFDSETQVWEKLSRFETVEDASAWIRRIMTTSNQYLAVKSSSSNTQIVERVKKYIECNFVKNISLEDMAADLFYSANYLNRIFKQETGETIFNYASAFRIDRAKDMLRDPRGKLSGVSEALGYSNPAYFSYIFKKATGLTPKEFRERMAK